MRALSGFISSVKTFLNPLAARHDELKLKELIIASGLFDPEYYISEYPDVAAVRFDPAIHYLRHGGIEGRNPSAQFDAAYYLATHMDVRENNINPLVHYLQHGRHENRRVRRPPPPAPRSKAPEESDWIKLASLSEAIDPTNSTIDVIVPVYRGYDETANCLFTVAQTRLVNTQQFDIVVVDDATPDPTLAQLLNKLSALKLITLLRNKENVGFVGSVNAGMELHGDRDVILLNSDTEVFGNWVDRIYCAAYSEPNIGTVTPLSNNATICSYPVFVRDFNAAFEVPFEEIDRLASEANAGLTVDIPTAVGFCMFIRRECVREVGLFDAKTFKRGYGEENDFSKRIVARGWRNVLTGDVFVRHLGRVSFKETANEHLTNALSIINFRYPTYHKEIATYIKNDPPKKLRYNLDIARLRRATGEKVFLFVQHNLGGGTLKHARELADLLAREGIGTLFLQPDPDNSEFAELINPSVDHLSTIKRIDIKHGLSAAIELLRALNIVHIHVHHLFGFGNEIIKFIQTAAQRGGIDYDFTVHDYLPVCPRLDMIDESGIYCDNLDLSVCETCVKKNGSSFGKVSVWHWREDYAQFLRGARKIFVPDEDVKTRLQWFFPSLAIAVRPHPEKIPNSIPVPLVRKDRSVLRVAIVGAISLRKGSVQMLRIAEDAHRRRLPIKYIVFGYTDQPKLAEFSNVEITGGYTEQDLASLLGRARCHLAFFPSVWPETYSYTLSQTYFSGLYPVSFDIGAIANRIRASGWGHVLPFDFVSKPAKVNDALLSLNPAKPPTNWMPPIGVARPGTVLGCYYEFTELTDTKLAPQKVLS